MCIKFVGKIFAALKRSRLQQKETLKAVLLYYFKG